MVKKSGMIHPRHSLWLILTVYMIFLSAFLSDDALPAMRRKMVYRAVGTVGTVGGIFIAAGLALVVTNQNALVICALVFATLAASRTLASAPYWQLVVLLTPAMVFLDSGGVHVDVTALTRLACTLIGIVLAAGAMEFNRSFTFPWIRESAELEAKENG